MTVNLTKPAIPDPGPGKPDRPGTALDRLTAGREPKPALDTTAPIRPEWLQTWDSFRYTASLVARRGAYRTARFVLHLPVLLALLVLYSPRGLARLIARTARFVYDSDTATLRAAHAARGETPEAVKVHAMRRANLHARWIVSATLALPVLVPVLMWTAPRVLAVCAAVFVFSLAVKVTPGRHWGEAVGAAGLAAAVGYWLPGLLVRVPGPPVWTAVPVVCAVVLALGVVGRPAGKPMLQANAYAAPDVPQKPTKEMVIDALCRIGLPGMTLQTADRVHSEIRVVAPGVATSAHGYTMELELPPGITAEMVVGKRGQLAGALRRDLGCVWPSGNEERHPGYLRLFLSHRPMNKGKQPPWPLASGKAVDIFDPIPLFTDEEMRWVSLTVGATPHLAVGGASGFGKSVWLRHLSCAVAFDPRVRLIVIDGKRSGDLDHVRKLAHAYHVGAEPDEITETIATLRGLVTEYTKRSKFLSGLPADERSPKVTSALASRYPKDLAPIIVFYDEVQEGTEYGVRTSKEDMRVRAEIVGLLTRLSRVGRSAGIFLVLASQKPDAGVIPSSIMGNCSIRVAFKVSDQVHNDQILGTSARKNGIDATMFGSRDKGMAWLKGGDDVDAQVVRSWSEMVDVGLADDLTEKAYELRRAGGWLTGAAAEDTTDKPVFEIDLLADVLDVMTNPPAKALHLVELVDALGLLRPGAWGRLDATALGAMLREGDIKVATVWSSRSGKDGKGCKRADVEAAIEQRAVGAEPAGGDGDDLTG